MYKVYYTKLRKTNDLVDSRNPDSPHYQAVDLVFVGMANSMAEAKLMTVCPILESVK
jgi:hypothetical protein